VLPLVLAACGQNGPTRTGEPPTRDWPDDTECPASVESVCAGKRLSLYGTINEPAGTTYGITSTENELFVICRWPEGAGAATCEQITTGGARVVGEAAVYRVEDD
jgi:hypothetical protein